jgi:hypothetical protein
MTSSSQLEEMVKKLNLKTPFRGVMMKDELNDLMNSECGIVNLNSSDVSKEENSKTDH